MPDEAVTNQVATARASEFIGMELEHGRQVSDQALAWLAEKGLAFAFDVLAAAVILLVGIIVIKLAGTVVRKALTRGQGSARPIVNFVGSVVDKAMWTVLAIVILGKLGVNVAPLVAGLGVTGFILGFAFQESLGNLASGLMIAINEPFKVGDSVDAAGFSGVILEVNMMATVMRTADNKRIVIPNKGVWGAPIVNYNAMGTRRVDFQIGIGYEADTSKAIAAIKEAIRGIPGILPEPEPQVEVGSLDDRSVLITVRPWVRSADYASVMSAVTVAALGALNKAGIDIPRNQILLRTAKD